MQPPTDPVARPEEYRQLLLSLLDGADPAAVQESTPQLLARLVREAGSALRTRPAAGEWSVIELLGHFVDAELVSAARYRWILAHDQPSIPAFDQDLWVERLGHGEGDPEVLLGEFETLRRANLRLWAQTPVRDRERYGIHAERGPESYATLFSMIAGHDRFHLEQIRQTLAGVQQPESAGAPIEGERQTHGEGCRTAAVRLKDYEQVVPLVTAYQQSYGVNDPDEDRNRAFFRRFVAPSEQGLLIGAWVGKRIVGFATLYWTHSSVAACDIALMNDLFVEDAHRGNGIGRALILAAVEAARERRLTRLDWYTASDNHQAQRLYDRLGAERSAILEYALAIEISPPDGSGDEEAGGLRSKTEGLSGVEQARRDEEHLVLEDFGDSD